MDAAGDPRVAMCGSSEEVAAIHAALAKLGKPPGGGGGAAITTASATDHVAGAAGMARDGTTNLAVQKPHIVNLSAVPSLAPFFKSGALARVPPSDLQYKPYSKDCPSMWYAAAE
ncbi:hypothetical protein Vafri_20199 [Volvox africanus]|uniref:Uncharacterized protein n=1 Tax=Volvox africanus TaxID=51714 RepID=A0A8J4F9D0_9CHLO|nr:hypothetical protein Vafri_20199 [Volvox africanus]